MANLANLSVPVDGNSNFTVQPKLSYRFRVLFDGIADATDTEVLTRNVISTTRPQIQFDEIQVHVFNSRIYLPGKHAFESLTVNFRDDITSEVQTLLDAQVEKQIEIVNQAQARAGARFKFAMSIENLDGGNPDPTVLDTWLLSGCYITNLTYNESNYTNTADFNTIDATIRYDVAEHIKPTPVPSEDDRATGGNAQIS